MNKNKLLYLFRRIAIAEGISFLLLLLFAMPLKYIAKIPEPVKVIGWAHGILFIGFLLLAFITGIQLKKRMGWFASAFFASIIPLGTFVFDKQLKKEQALLLTRI
jgi:integral membrane protein